MEAESLAPAVVQLSPVGAQRASRKRRPIPREEHMSAFERFRTGDYAAFEEVVAEYAGPAYAVAAAILGEGSEAERAAADGLLDAWEHGSALVRPPANERLWVLTMVRRLAIDKRRKRKPARDDDRGRLTLILLATADASWEAELALLVPHDVDDALDLLPEETRQVIELAHVHALRPREIAKRLKVPEDTVRERLRFGLQQLRDSLTPSAVGQP